MEKQEHPTFGNGKICYLELPSRNIDILDKKASGYVRVYDHNMDNPKRFGINLNPNTNKYQMDLLVNPQFLSPDTSITLIKFGDKIPDTIRAIILKEGGFTHISHVSINGISFNKDQSYMIIK